eukprot:CAMPEP_0196655156 /NCGR_PEP_ID=MMETSP1086-20130531/4904_1 /TAXON_ID=77921 /ORGANISM="Cyanoptyche  gloeocystis , Strain SAG4.97" /LENGTH=289 /DNA_ID=CAMNT_0041987313 /DNA_START=315 /DNA_END=1185 /DNA_ORIENTATION=-
MQQMRRRPKCILASGKKIVTAVKAGGPDPDTNATLKSVLKEARALSVPQDNIERCIKRAQDSSQEAYNEVMYEAIGPGGVGLLIEVLTDNNNRAASEVRKVINKGGGKVASPGAVAFNFERKGVLRLDLARKFEDDLLMAATEAGADDIVSVPEGGFAVYTQPSDMMAVVDALAHQGFNVAPENINIEMVALNHHDVDDDHAASTLQLIESLEDLDDVNQVFHNMNYAWRQRRDADLPNSSMHAPSIQRTPCSLPNAPMSPITSRPARSTMPYPEKHGNKASHRVNPQP